MNIGIVTTWFPSGAGYVSKAYRDILSVDNVVYIYARGGKVMKGDPVWDDEYVTWDPRHYNYIQLSSFKKWIKGRKIDIVFFNEQNYWKPVVWLKKQGICIGSYVDYYKQTTVQAFNIYDFLICNTLRHYSVFKGHKNCYYIPWGTNIDVFSPKRNELVRPLTFILSLGWEGNYSSDRKGLLLAIEAFQKAKGDCVLLIYSQVELSKCLNVWQEKIKKDSRIVFIYGTYEPFPFNEGDVYLYPSRLDGIGLSLPEALSSGLPAITTNCPPMSEFVIDNLNGSLVKVDRFLGREDGYYWPESICNIESLTDSIQKYIDNPHLVKSEGMAARKYAELKLNWIINSMPVIEIFNKSVYNKTAIDENLIDIIKKLDNRMATSLSMRILMIIQIIVLNLKERISFLLK